MNPNKTLVSLYLILIAFAFYVSADIDVLSARKRLIELSKELPALAKRQGCPWGTTINLKAGRCDCFANWRRQANGQCCSPNSVYVAGSGCTCPSGTSWDSKKNTYGDVYASDGTQPDWTRCSSNSVCSCGCCQKAAVGVFYCLKNYDYLEWDACLPASSSIPSPVPPSPAPIICPANSSLKNGKCVCNDSYMTMQNGVCVCPENSIIYDGKCLPCSESAYAENNLCKCAEWMETVSEPINGLPNCVDRHYVNACITGYCSYPGNMDQYCGCRHLKQCELESGALSIDQPNCQNDSWESICKALQNFCGTKGFGITDEESAKDARKDNKYKFKNNTVKKNRPRGDDLIADGCAIACGISYVVGHNWQ
ncbi:hypothetical protein HK098_007094 [Nowakowskiella sp. JEL0407]|nr:hypothetical protein HK098_007094 [Nowakowskiella sp. JEL0407]